MSATLVPGPSLLSATEAVLVSLLQTKLTPCSPFINQQQLPCRSSGVLQKSVQVLGHGFPVPPHESQDYNQEQRGKRTATRFHQRNYTVRDRRDEH